MTKIFFATTFTSLIIAGMNFLSGIMIARMLLPEDRGLLGSIIFFVPIISFFFISGLQESANYYISKFQKHKEKLIKSSVVMSHKLGALALLLSLIFQAVYFSDLDTLVYISAIIFSLQAFVGLSSTVMLECDLGNFNFAKYNKTRLISYGVYILGVGLLFVQNIDKNWELFWLILLNFLLILSTYIYRINSFMKIIVSTATSQKLEKVLFFHGLKFHYSNLLSFLNKQADKFIVMKFISLEMFGYYLVAWNFLYTISSLVSSSLASIAMPHLRRSKDIVKSSIKYVVYSSILTLATVLVVGIFSYYSIALLYSENYKFSETLSLYLMLPVFFILIKDLMYKVFKSNNMTKKPLYAEILFIGMFSILIFVFGSSDIYTFIWVFTASLGLACVYLFYGMYIMKKGLYSDK
ncbi:MAG: oligosaccharide flippase family protein [Arcobacteraceae bacterium]|nr:oligosaccharide flippase family protein [Bacteroidales bacterium]MDY0364503.1 oligosaccharide flippase family protein [Arcobacteraceae bacterium]